MGGLLTCCTARYLISNEDNFRYLLKSIARDIILKKYQVVIQVQYQINLEEYHHDIKLAETAQSSNKDYNNSTD